MDDQFLNVSRPANIPVRRGTESYPARARLVALDGSQTWVEAVVVRHAPPSHVMCRIAGTATTRPGALGYTSDSCYLWLRAEDVDGARL